MKHCLEWTIEAILALALTFGMMIVYEICFIPPDWRWWW
jgi:hypothetical protein